MTFPRAISPRAEALLYLRWERGAAGRFTPGPLEVPSERPPERAAGTVPPPPTPIAGHAPAPIAPPVPQRIASSVAEKASEGAAQGDPLEALRLEASTCRRCRLCETRTTVVFGEGARRPRLMVIGEAPGADEDASGRPFVGKAGQLLTKMLAAIGLAREDVFIANVLKCRPPENRPPAPDEAAACRPYLEEQIRLLDPELILVLGNPAAKAVLSTDRGITSIRGTIRTTPEGRRVLPTFHPSYLLRTPDAKREAWLDLKLVAKTLGLALPPAASPPRSDGP